MRGLTAVVLALAVVLVLCIGVLIYFLIRPGHGHGGNGQGSGHGHSGSGNGHGPAPSTKGIDLQAQPGSSMQIVNETSDGYLHVFLQLDATTQSWTKVEGAGSIYPPISWGGGKEWAPLGAKIAQEAVIPQNGYIVLSLPDLAKGHVFVVQAIKLKDGGDPKPLTETEPYSDGRPSRVLAQAAVLIEGGKEVVADTSAVDGINFRVHYELTSKDGDQATWMEANPCEGLPAKYQIAGGVGCHNPAKVDCSTPTCACENCPTDDQDCAFNACSQELFAIPSDLQKFIGVCDGGNPKGAPVKKFINDTKNLKPGTPLAKYCAAVNGPPSAGFSTYCYDFNDVGSSPWLAPPYKLKVTYSDL